MKPFHEYIFCVFACDTIEKYKKQIHKIEETWGQDADGAEGPHHKGVDRQDADGAFGPHHKGVDRQGGDGAEGPHHKGVDRQGGDGAEGPHHKGPDNQSSDKVLFFLGESGPLVGENYIRLENVGDDYLSAADKQYLGIKYIYENYDFNFLYFCGTDTFVLVDNLKKYVRDNNIDPNDFIVVGGHGDNRMFREVNVHFFSGGAGMLLTKSTVKSIYPQLHTFQEEWRDTCVACNCVTYIPACDVSICYFLKMYNIRFHNAHNRFFNCNYLGNNTTPRGVIPCCTRTVDINTMIACHGMSLEEFDTFHSILSIKGT